MSRRRMVRSLIMFGCDQVGSPQEIMGQNQVRLPLHALVADANGLLDFSLAHVGIGQPGIRFTKLGIKLNGALAVSRCMIQIGWICAVNVAHRMCGAEGSEGQSVIWI